MPWDHTELWVAELDRRRSSAGKRSVIAGDRGESITQPRWSAAGVLHYVSDRSGWWNLYDETGTALCPLDAEFGRAGLGVRQRPPTGSCPMVSWWPCGRGRAGSRRAHRRRAGHAAGVSFFSYDGTASRRRAAWSPSPPRRPVPPAWCASDPEDRSVLRRSREVPHRRGRHLHARAVAFPTGGRRDRPRPVLRRPAIPDFAGPDGERPPVVVMIHGGPTASTARSVQPGGAVLDQPGVRSGRRRLPGQHGLRHRLPAAAQRRVGRRRRGGLRPRRRLAGRPGPGRRPPGSDPRRAAPAGSRPWRRWRSPICLRPGPATSASADLELLARDTHKFESRYLDGLVGPWPEAAAEYRASLTDPPRGQISCPLILFQGLEDAIVPPAQSELMYEALREPGRPGRLPARSPASSTASARRRPSSRWPRRSWRSTGGCFGFMPDGGASSLRSPTRRTLSPRA